MVEGESGRAGGGRVPPESETSSAGAPAGPASGSPLLAQRRPSWAAVQRPVCSRQRSTASCRATATMAFLRAAPVARAPLPRMPILFATGGYCGWKRTNRHASSTSAARLRALASGIFLRRRRLPGMTSRRAFGSAMGARPALLAAHVRAERQPHRRPEQRHPSAAHLLRVRQSAFP